MLLLVNSHHVLPIVSRRISSWLYRCSDCDVELVAEQPSDEVRAAGTEDFVFVGEDEQSLRVVWQGDDESECLSLCRDLQKAGLYYRAAQAVKSRLIRMGLRGTSRLAYQLRTDKALAFTGHYALSCVLLTPLRGGCRGAGAFTYADGPIRPIRVRYSGSLRRFWKAVSIARYSK